MQLLVRLLNRKTGVKTAAILLVVTLLILTLATMTTGAPGVMLGDVNDDGEIDVRDVVWVMQYILDLRDLTEGQQKAADVNVDGEINVLDVTLIMQHILGITDIAKVIANVEEVEITVPYGTTVDLIEFPETVTATLQDDTEVEVDVEWEDTSDPEYNPLSANDYAFKGELVDLPLGVSNPDEIEATAIVTVAPLNIPPKLDPVPENSTYVFTYDFDDKISPGVDVYADVTFATEFLGLAGYDNVRFAFEAEGPGDVTFKAEDSEGTLHTFTNEGFWGPAAGFDLPAEYSETTVWVLNFSEYGEYTITFSLIEAPDGPTVAGITDSVEVSVGVPSTYMFTYDVTDAITTADYVYGISANEYVYADVTFETVVSGDFGYQGVRFAIKTDGPDDSTVTFTATDSNNVEHTFENEGYWGPSDGFDVPADYTATTPFILTFSANGMYTITFSLIDATTEEVIDGIMDSVDVWVGPGSPTTGIDPL